VPVVAAVRRPLIGPRRPWPVSGWYDPATPSFKTLFGRIPRPCTFRSAPWGLACWWRLKTKCSALVPVWVVSFQLCSALSCGLSNPYYALLPTTLYYPALPTSKSGLNPTSSPAPPWSSCLTNTNQTRRGKSKERKKNKSQRPPCTDLRPALPGPATGPRTWHLGFCGAATPRLASSLPRSLGLWIKLVMTPTLSLPQSRVLIVRPSNLTSSFFHSSFLPFAAGHLLSFFQSIHLLLTDFTSLLIPWGHRRLSTRIFSSHIHLYQLPSLPPLPLPLPLSLPPGRLSPTGLSLSLSLYRT